MTKTNKETLTAILVAAASNSESGTGAAYMWTLKDIKAHKWEKHSYHTGEAYATDKCLVGAFSMGIDAAAQYAAREYPDRLLRIECVTYADSIVNSFNKQRPIWESNGYINRLGRPVKNQRAWKALFKKADTHRAIVRKPLKVCQVLTSCLYLARNASVTAAEQKIENETAAQVRRALEKDAK